MAAQNRPRLLILIVLLLAAAIAVAAAVLWRYGATWASRALIEQLEARLPGRVTLDTPLQWQLFPPKLRLDGLHWRAPDGRQGRIDIAGLALRTEWAGDGQAGARPVGIEVFGLRAELFQDDAGRWTLPRPPDAAASGGEALVWTLAGLTLNDAHLVVHPWEAPPVVLTVERATFEPVADAGSELNVSARIERRDDVVNGAFSANVHWQDGGVLLAPLTLTVKGERGALEGASMQVEAARAQVDPTGRASALTVTARAQITRDAQRAELQADIKDAQLNAGTLQAKVARFEMALPPPADTLLSLREATLSADATALSVAPLAGTLRWQGAEPAVEVTLAEGELRFDLAEPRIDVRVGDWRVPVPDPSRAGAQVILDGMLDGRLWPDTLRGEGRVTAQAESTRLDGQWQIDGHQARWARLEGRVDALDLDRWLPPPAGDSPRPAPLDAWRGLPLSLDLQVGALRWQGLSVRDARLQLNAGEGPQLRAE